jgi:hypothetical protein
MPVFRIMKPMQPTKKTMIFKRMVFMVAPGTWRTLGRAAGVRCYMKSKRRASRIVFRSEAGQSPCVGAGAKAGLFLCETSFVALRSCEEHGGGPVGLSEPCMMHAPKQAGGGYASSKSY